MTPIPVPVRQRIVQLYDRGKSTREIAQFYGFCMAAVRRVRQRFHQRRTLEPRTQRSGRRTLLTAQRRQRIEELLPEQPDATLAELGAGLDRRFRTSRSISGCGNWAGGIPTWPKEERSGMNSRSCTPSSAWFLSMKAGPTRRRRGCAAGPSEEEDWWAAFPAETIGPAVGSPASVGTALALLGCSKDPERRNVFGLGGGSPGTRLAGG